MTTTKELEDLRFWLKEVIYAPQYAGKIINAVPKLIAAIEANQAKNQQLAEEFRRLAAEAQRRSEQHVQHANQSGALSAMGKATVWRQAALMLEEELNG